MADGRRYRPRRVSSYLAHLPARLLGGTMPLVVLSLTLPPSAAGGSCLPRARGRHRAVHPARTAVVVWSSGDLLRATLHLCVCYRGAPTDSTGLRRELGHGMLMLPSV